jgi:hypothetical protein
LGKRLGSDIVIYWFTCQIHAVASGSGRRLHGHYFVLSLDKVINRGTAMFVEVAKDVHLNLRYVVHYEVFDNGPYGRYARFHTVDGKVVDSDATVVTVETLQNHMQGQVKTW